MAVQPRIAPMLAAPAVCQPRTTQRAFEVKQTTIEAPRSPRGRRAAATEAAALLVPGPGHGVWSWPGPGAVSGIAPPSSSMRIARAS